MTAGTSNCSSGQASSSTSPAVPGREVVQVRVDFEPGVVAPKRKRPDEFGFYVLAGSLEYQLEGKPPVTLKAGDVLFIPAGSRPPGEERRRQQRGGAHATYVVEKGKPLVVLVP